LELWSAVPVRLFCRILFGMKFRPRYLSKSYKIVGGNLYERWCSFPTGDGV
jgi:hypothetical protein